jgi:peptide deformylase
MRMVKKILTVPHQALNQVAHSVKNFDSYLVGTVQDMVETLLDQKDPIGVGLSGNQIGFLQRVCVIRPEEKGDVQVLINPTIIKTVQGSSKRKPVLEGCLSIPDVWGHVLRPEKVHITYQNLKGEKLDAAFDGFPAVVVQHEIDHLNGILFTQHTLSQGYQLYREIEGELEPYAL